MTFTDLDLGKTYRVTQKRGHHLQLQSRVTRSKKNIFERFKKQKNRVVIFLPSYIALKL